MTCKVQKYIYIYKGDDTNWNNEQFVTFNLTSSTTDLSTMTAKFTLGSYVVDNISLETGSFQIDLSAAVSGSFAFGPINGILQIFDSEGRVKTVANQIPFYITDQVITEQNQEITIPVPEGSEINIDVQVGGEGNFATWGNIVGELQNQTDLWNELQSKQAVITDLETIRSGASEGATAVQPETMSAQLATKQDSLSTEQIAATNSGITTAGVNQIGTNANSIANIEDKIPTQASQENQLADKDFVNSTVNSLAAFYITSDIQGDPFATKAALLAGPYYSGGEIRVITRNDYALVVEDETHNNKTSRYLYDGEQWVWQYVINDTQFTAAQLAALNSGITSAGVAQIGTNTTAISGKQDTLTAGDNIDITNNTVSVTGVYTPNNLLAGQNISINPLTSAYTLTATSGTYAYTSQVFNLNAANSWSYNTRYKYQVQQNGGPQWLFGNSNGYYTGPMLFIGSNKKLGVYLSSANGRFDLAQEVFLPSMTFEEGKEYEISLWYTNTDGYNFTVTDILAEQTYNFNITTNTAAVNNTVPTYFMNNMGGLSTSYNQGIMYLADTSIIVDGVKVFDGATAQIANTEQAGIDLINAGLTIGTVPATGKYVISAPIDTSTLQPKTLSTAIVVDGTTETTVEGALGAVNTLAGKGLQNKATQNSSIIIAPNTTTTFGSTSSIYIGNGTWGSIANFTTVIGAGISQGPNNIGSTVVGYGAKSTSNNGTAFGRDANSLAAGVSIGYSANANAGLAVGSFSKSSSGSVAIGTGYSTSKGIQATAYRSIAIGTATDGTDEVVASAQDAIQLGVGTNATAKTLQVFEHQLLDGTTGLIPGDRIPYATSSTKGGLKVDFDSTTGVLNLITE